MNTRLLPVIVLSALVVSACAESPSLTTEKQKLSYVVGHQIGQSLKRDGLDIDSKTLAAAVEDVMTDAKPKLTDEEMQAVMVAYQKARVEERQALADKNLKAGQAYLDENKKKKDVVTTASGLQYRVITAGKGKKPKATDTVVAHYRGTLIGGKEFDSSLGRGEPATFPVKGVIKGWQEALQLMPEGSKWEVVIPGDLAYGAHGAGGTIGPNETLIFEIELLKIK